MNDSPPAPPAPSGTEVSEQRQLRRAHKQAQRRKQRLLDSVWLALAVVTLLVLGLSLYGHQQKLSRVSKELADLKKAANPGAAGTGGPFKAVVDRSGRPGAPQHPIAGIQQAADEAGQCPRATAAQREFKKQFLAPIHYWSQTELRNLRGQRVAYLFSGPDIATAAALFGASDHLTLVADQWVEHLDDATSSAARQAAECKTLAHYSRFGYFRTHDLEGRGSTRPRFLHLLLHNILLADLRIEAAEYLAIDAQGQPHSVRLDAGQKVAGVRFHVRRHDDSAALIDYLRVDLSDSSLKRSAGEREFLRMTLSDVVLLKSASHLLQEPMFSITAEMITRHAQSVVQDETGMPIGALQRHFDLRLFGDFADAHRLWSGKSAVQELRTFRAAVGDAEPLYFTFGYEKRMGSLILVGSRRKDPVKVAHAPGWR